MTTEYNNTDLRRDSSPTRDASFSYYPTPAGKKKGSGTSCCPCLRKKKKVRNFSSRPQSKPFEDMTPEEKRAHARMLWGVVRRHLMLVRFKKRTELMVNVRQESR